MDNFTLELDYYLKHPSQIHTNERHLIRLYGYARYKSMLAEVNKSNSTKVLKSKYQSRVRFLTEKQPLSQLKGIEDRGFEKMHVDHIVSVHHAFKLGWTPEQCADISNLQLLTFEENKEKSTSSYCKWPPN